MNNTGILTIAFGKKYLEMAKSLSLSLKKTNPNIPRAIVTNEEGRSFLKDHYDIFIDLKEGLKSNLYHKIHLVDYSPFSETLFIDSDCLVYKDLQPVLSLLQVQSFSNVGKELNHGEWYMDVQDVLNRFGLASIPQINGGIYYFRKDTITASIQQKALEIAGKYSESGLTPFSDGGINEEPVYALAMALNKLTVVPDNEKIAMYTPLGLNGSLDLDILDGVTRFEKHGQVVRPSIVHFCGPISNQFHYKRDVYRLRLWNDHVPIVLIRILEIFKFQIPYAAFVFIKRVAKKITGRKNVQFTPLHPLYSNQ